MTSDDRQLEETAGILRRARRAVALTGAGISTESGIPDFRSPGGIWSRFDPIAFSFANFVASQEARAAFWRWGMELWPTLMAARPNAGHLALAELERAGHLRCVITQNVDELHQRAGSHNVIELHGNATRIGCLRCQAEVPPEEAQAQLLAGHDPRCPGCGGILKARVVLFGEELPAAALHEARDAVEDADVMLAIGSSLLVYPAAELVPRARAAGAAVIVINRTPTGVDEQAHITLRGDAGPILSRLAELTLQHPCSVHDGR